MHTSFTRKNINSATDLDFRQDDGEEFFKVDLAVAVLVGGAHDGLNGFGRDLVAEHPHTFGDLGGGEGAVRVLVDLGEQRAHSLHFGNIHSEFERERTVIHGGSAAAVRLLLLGAGRLVTLHQQSIPEHLIFVFRSRVGHGGGPLEFDQILVPTGGGLEGTRRRRARIRGRLGD